MSCVFISIRVFFLPSLSLGGVRNVAGDADNFCHRHRTGKEPGENQT